MPNSLIWFFTCLLIRSCGHSLLGVPSINNIRRLTFAWHHSPAHDRPGHQAGARGAPTGSTVDIVIANVRQELQRILVDQQQQRQHHQRRHIRAIGASGNSNGAAPSALSAPHRAVGFRHRKRLDASLHKG